MNYWIEAVSEAFDVAKIIATSEQITLVADFMDGAHESYGMAFGHDFIPNPLVEEVKSLKDKLKQERSKTTCYKCNGSGILTENLVAHTSTEQCWICKGEGRCKP